MMLVSQLQKIGKERLEEVGVEEAETDTNVLLGFCLKKSRTELFLAARDVVTPSEEEIFLKFLDRRLNREPVAYIIGTREFWSLPFKVSKDVLIPRPETEFLLERVLHKTSETRIDGILDLCCGSGVIACVLALELKQQVTAIDVSNKALAITSHNVKEHNLEESVQILQSDLFDNLPTSKKYSLIVSNPPYITHNDVCQNLEPEVSQYEPWLALDGGDLGMDIIERIAKDISSVLHRPGNLFIEIGAEQGAMVTELFESTKYFDSVQIYQDYSGRDRVLHACVE